jgi:predicted alpha/beta hydrolase
MTFDVRGLGASLPPGTSVRSVQGDMLTWAQQDFATAVDTLCKHTGAAQVNVIGHSLGSHHPAICLPHTQGQIAKLVSVAAGSGYWRDWAPPSRKLAPLLLHVAAPLLTPLFGYFPGKRLGMVGDIPKGMITQWTGWCRHPGFAWGKQPELIRPLMQAARYPISAVSFSDDEAMSVTATEKYLAALANAPSTLEVLTPAKMGVKRIGHLGAFRKEMQSSVWPHLARLLS